MVRMKTVLCLLIGNIRYDGRVRKEIASLKKAGNNVTLMVSSFDKEDSYDNYDFDIAFLPRKNGGGFFQKAFRSISYFFKIRSLIKRINPDIIHCNDLNTLIFTWGLDRRYGVIYDSHELYLEGKVGILKLFWSFCEERLIQKCNRVIVPQIDRLYYIYFRYNLALEKLCLIENFPLKAVGLSKTYFCDTYGVETEGKTIISYIGAITRERAIDVLIQSVVDVDSVLLFVIGSSKGDPAYYQQLQMSIDKFQLTQRVYLFPPIPHDRVLDVVNSSNIGVCFYTDKNFNSYFSASNKLYEYLNLGVKVLTNDTASTMRTIEHGVDGYCCSCVDVESVKEGIISLMNVPTPLPTNYYWDNQENYFLKLYE